jgi:hypothetical protein
LNSPQFRADNLCYDISAAQQRFSVLTVVARIVTMVEEASATKATTQLFIEKVERVYSVGVVAATIAVFAIPLAFGTSVEDALLRAMTFMIVASPCAVVLATDAPAARGDGQRRPPRRLGEIGCGDGTTRLGYHDRLRQNRNPDPRRPMGI